MQYGSLENIYAHVEEISKKSIRESLIANRELADLSKVLVTIRTDADVSIDYEMSRADGFYTEEAYALLKQLEFRNMLSRFDKEKREDNSDISASFRRLDRKEEFLRNLGNIKKNQRAGLYVATEGRRLLAVAVSAGGETYVYVLPARENVQLSFFRRRKRRCLAMKTRRHV